MSDDNDDMGREVERALEAANVRANEDAERIVYGEETSAAVPAIPHLKPGEGGAAGIDEAPDPEEPPAAALARLQRELTIAAQQRDFLSGQVNSLVQRVAGLHVAHGTMDMAAAQGFVQKEILPINQVLAQIAAATAEDRP